MKKFIAMLTMAAVMFASIGCGGEGDKKKDAPKKADEAKKDEGKKTP